MTKLSSPATARVMKRVTPIQNQPQQSPAIDKDRKEPLKQQRSLRSEQYQLQQSHLPVVQAEFFGDDWTHSVPPVPPTSRNEEETDLEKLIRKHQPRAMFVNMPIGEGRAGPIFERFFADEAVEKYRLALKADPDEPLIANLGEEEEDKFCAIDCMTGGTVLEKKLPVAADSSPPVPSITSAAVILGSL